MRRGGASGGRGKAGGGRGARRFHAAARVPRGRPTRETNRRRETKRRMETKRRGPTCWRRTGG